MNLGVGSVSKLYLGSTEATKAYLGSTLVLDNSGPGVPSNTLLTSLEACFPLNETGTADRVDITGNADNLVVQSGTFGSATGKLGNAASLTASNSEWAESVWDGPGMAGPWSVGAWFKTTSSGDVCIWSCGVTFGSNGQNTSCIIENGTPFVRVFGGYRSWTGTFNDGNWHYILITAPTAASTSNMECYVDGTLLTALGTSARTLVDSGATQRTRLGAALATAGDFFDGDIDQLAFWSRQLDTTDRSAVYNSGDGLAYANWS